MIVIAFNYQIYLVVYHELSGADTETYFSSE